MAAPADARGTPLTPLETIARMLGDLPEIATEWEHLTVDERLSWSLDWGNEMSKLEDLTREASAGVLLPKELDRYFELLGQLGRAMPTVTRLGLRRLSLPLEV